MEFGNDDILRKLERPPNKKNLTPYNIIQLVLMLILCCTAGFNIIYNFLYGKSPFLYYFSLICNLLLFIGAIVSFWGIAAENNATLKTGFSLFFVGCLLFIIEVIFRLFKFGFEIEYFIECLIALILGFVTMKQMQHI